MCADKRFVVCHGQVWSANDYSGKVVSVESGNPVDGANIRVDHSLAGCSTNAKGEFVLRNLPEGTHELRVTHVSYAPRSVTVKSGESQVVVQLENSYINIGQVVVTGTGTHRRMKDSPVPGIGYYGSGYPGSQPLDHGRSID